MLFNSDVGRTWLANERGLSGELLHAMGHFGLSSLCNVLAAIELAKHWLLSADQAILTVATDGAAMYASEIEKTVAARFDGRFDADAAAAVFADDLVGTGDRDLLVLTDRDRDRIFNLGYFTWVEQQGVELADFEARRDQEFWLGLRELVPLWDGLIDRFNRAAGAPSSM